ncbi:phage tail protein, partial [Lacticaseibacillus paracasei]
ETYDIDLVNSPYVPLNQTVHIADENQQLFLSAKVLSIQRSRANHSVQLTLGEFAHETVSFDQRLSDLANQMANMAKTLKFYPWTRYADDDKGTNMSALPAGKKYRAIVWSDKTSVPSDNPADYANRWELIQGEDGADGKPGPKGADGTSSYLHTAYANSIDGKTDFSVTDASGRSYFGQYVDETQADSTDPTRYLWALFKGQDGRNGKDGSDNVPVVTVGPSYPAKPKAGDQHWLTDEDGNLAAFAIFDTTSGWDSKPIAAKALNAETFNGMTFNGVTFNGSTFISSFNHI